LQKGEAGSLKPHILCSRVGEESGHADQINVTAYTPLEKAIPITAGANAEKLDPGRASRLLLRVCSGIYCGIIGLTIVVRVPILGCGDPRELSLEGTSTDGGLALSDQVDLRLVLGDRELTCSLTSKV
jgi:hypothetical protein